MSDRLTQWIDEMNESMSALEIGCELTYEQGPEIDVPAWLGTICINDVLCIFDKDNPKEYCRIRL